MAQRGRSRSAGSGRSAPKLVVLAPSRDSRICRAAHLAGAIPLRPAPRKRERCCGRACEEQTLGQSLQSLLFFFLAVRSCSKHIQRTATVGATSMEATAFIFRVWRSGAEG